MMRLLAMTCAILVLSNVVVYFWPDKANFAPHVYAVQADVNPHFLRLNKEIEDKFYSKPVTTLAASSVDGAIELAGHAESNCYRIGPFMHQSNYELAQAVLFNADVDYKKSKRESKESSVYRVYIGPYASQAEVADARVELKRKKVLDHFVRKNSDGELIISLGIYTTQTTAETAVRLFDGKLEDVRLKNELVVLPDSYWLHFAIDDEDQIRQQLVQMDWGEQSAKMGKYQCQI